MVERAKDLNCARCGGIQLRIKTRVRRKLKHGMWNNRLVWLDLLVPKYFCRSCKRYFMTSIPGVLPRRRASKQFRQEVFHTHQAGVTQLQLTRTHRISCSTLNCGALGLKQIYEYKAGLVELLLKKTPEMIRSEKLDPTVALAH